MFFLSPIDSTFYYVYDRLFKDLRTGELMGKLIAS